MSKDDPRQNLRFDLQNLYYWWLCFSKRSSSRRNFSRCHESHCFLVLLAVVIFKELPFEWCILKPKQNVSRYPCYACWRAIGATDVCSEGLEIMIRIVSSKWSRVPFQLSKVLFSRREDWVERSCRRGVFSFTSTHLFTASGEDALNSQSQNWRRIYGYCKWVAEFPWKGKVNITDCYSLREESVVVFLPEKESIPWEEYHSCLSFLGSNFGEDVVRLLHSKANLTAVLQKSIFNY